MHARMVHANISDLAEAKRGLDEEILRAIKGAPGFVGAYFVAADDTHGISIEVFETEEQARIFSPPVGAEAPGVTVGAVQFGVVIGSA
jgi:microsomal dipeptidase-like Zn-dependent dipeptidase